MESIKWFVIITLLFNAMDVITGLLGAIKKKVLDSKILREGLFHKGGFILALVFAVLIEFAQTKIELGFNIPVVQAIAIYIIFTEITSICENLCKLNSKLSRKKLMSILKKVGDK